MKVNFLLLYQIVAAAPATGSVAPAISLTDKALNHLHKMRSERNEDLCLRIGVKQGGCSGMSYTMEFENRANSRSDDSIIEYNGFVIGMFVRIHSFVLEGITWHGYLRKIQLQKRMIPVPILSYDAV